MRVLITGCAGFIGAALSQRLLERGDEVVGIDNLNDYYPPELKQARIAEISKTGGERFVFCNADFSEMELLEATLANETFDRIVHLGAQAGVRYSIENPHAYIQSNIAGHLNLLEIARHRSVEHMVYASSSSVYGGNDNWPFSVEDRVDHPVSLYAATKRSDELMSETYAHLYRLPLTGLRFFTVYGPWGRPDMMLWKFTERIMSGQPIQVFNNGDMYRDFTYIDDIVSGIVACLDSPPSDDEKAKPGGSTKPHALYNIGNNKPAHLMKVVSIIEGACGRKAELEMLPMQAGDVPRTWADIDDIARLLGYRPLVSIEDGIPKFVDWYRQYQAE